MQVDPEPEEGEMKPRYGVTVGLTADFAFNRSVGLSLRGSYSQNGFKAVFEEEGSSGFNTDNAELSVLLTARPGSGPLRLLVGPAMAFNLSCTVWVDSTVSRSWDCGDETDDGTIVDAAAAGFGLTAGAGVTGGGGIPYSLDVLYTLGLSDAFDETEVRSKHRGAKLVAGISFPLGR